MGQVSRTVTGWQVIPDARSSGVAYQPTERDERTGIMLARLIDAGIALAIVGGPVMVVGRARALRAARRSRRLARRLNWYGNVR